MAAMLSGMKQILEKQLHLIRLQLLKLLPFFPIFFIYKWLVTRNISSKNFPPSPPKLPILGNLHQLSTQPHRSLHSLSQQYGELMLLNFGKTPTLVVSSARAAREIMKTHDAAFANRPVSKTSRKLYYNCKGVTIAPYQEHWRQMKSICVVHLLNNKRVRSFHSTREEEVAHVIEEIKQAAAAPVNLSELFMSFANDVICRVTMGKKYMEREDGIHLNQLLNESMKLLSRFNVGDSIPWLAWIDRISGWDAKVEKIAKEFDHFLEKVIREHQDHLAGHIKCEESNADLKVKDFVDILLDLQKDNAARIPIDRNSIKALILDVFSAATDTTSALLEWVMTELLRNPQVMQKVQKEARKITGDSLDVKEEDLEYMKYLKAVIKETLRLHPPAPLLAPRQSIQEVKIDGYDIPAGTSVFTNAWAIHRDPASWEEPDRFNPDRFLNSPTDFTGHDFQFIPFGAGRRMCPGLLFSLASSELLLANILHKFDWALPKGEKLDLSECFTFILHRSSHLLAVATPHDRS